MMEGRIYRYLMHLSKNKKYIDTQKIWDKMKMHVYNEDEKLDLIKKIRERNGEIK